MAATSIASSVEDHGLGVYMTRKCPPPGIDIWWSNDCLGPRRHWWQRPFRLLQDPKKHQSAMSDPASLVLLLHSGIRFLNGWHCLTAVYVNGRTDIEFPDDSSHPSNSIKPNLLPFAQSPSKFPFVPDPQTRTALARDSTPIFPLRWRRDPSGPY